MVNVRWLKSPLVVVPLLIFIGCLTVYVSCLPPSITWINVSADSGDFATAVANFGVPHPPGYPTYVLVGRLFTLIPVGDTAFRLNVLSAVAGAASVVCIFFATIHLIRLVGLQTRSEIGKRPACSEKVDDWQVCLSALVGALALAFGPVFWSQSIVTEVYTLNALFGAVIAVLALSWLASRAEGGRPSISRPLAAAFLFGLGLGNHLTVAALAAPLLAILAFHVCRVRPFHLVLLAAGVAVGLGVYGYLPIAAAQTPPVNWGGADSWDGFRWMVTGGFYTDFFFGLPFADFDDRVVAWVDLMLDHFVAGLAVAAMGVWFLWRAQRPLSYALGFTFVSISIYATFYETGDSFVFLIPALQVLALWIGLGSYVLANKVLEPYLERYAVRRRAIVAAIVVTVVLVVSVPGLSVLRNYPDHGGIHLDLSHDREALDFNEQVFREVEDDAVIMTLRDHDVFALWYHKYVVEKNWGVLLVARNFIQFDWYVDDLRELHPGLMPEEIPWDFWDGIRSVLDLHVGERPVYLTFDDVPPADDYELEEAGPLFRVVRKR